MSLNTSRIDLEYIQSTNTVKAWKKNHAERFHFLLNQLDLMLRKALCWLTDKIYLLTNWTPKLFPSSKSNSKQISLKVHTLIQWNTLTAVGHMPFRLMLATFHQLQKSLASLYNLLTVLQIQYTYMQVLCNFEFIN